MIIVLPAFLILVCLACGQKINESQSKSDTPGHPALEKEIKTVNIDTIKIDTFQRSDLSSMKIISEIDQRLEYFKDNDSLVKKAMKFIQLHENDSLIEVSAFDGYEEFYASYSILTKDDRIIFISESPYSSEGDWYWIQQYHFRENGDILAFRIYYSEINGSVPGNLVQEELTCYYNEDKKLIKRKYHILDTDDHDLDFRKLSVVPTFHDSKPPATLDELIHQKPFLKRLY